MQADRIVWVDYAKFLAIALVVLGHLPLTDDNLVRFIFSFHVPAFFMISGFLFKYDSAIKWKDFLAKNILQLLYPLLVYMVIGLLFGSLINYIFYHQSFSDIGNAFLQRLQGRDFGPCWFLLVLFYMRLASFLFRGTLIRMWIASMLLVVFYCICLVDIPWYISQFVIAYPFFVAGTALKQIKDKISFCTAGMIFAITLGLEIYLLCNNFIPYLNLYNMVLGNTPPMLYYLLSFVGSFMLLSFCMLICRKRSAFVELVSNGTLVILGLHMPLVLIIKGLYKKLFMINTPPPYMDTLSGIVSVCLIVLILHYPIKYILASNMKYVRLLGGKFK